MKKLRFPKAAMTEWQQKMKSVSQRDNFLLQNQMWTDCAFFVGEEEQEFKCHRLHLAKSSPVFAAMLYGDLANQSGFIHITDITPEAFSIMLQYIYEGRVTPRNMEEAQGLFLCARKYLLPEDVLDDCRGFIWASIYPDNVWLGLQFAIENEEPELYDVSVLALQKVNSTAFHSPSIANTTHATLLTALRYHLPSGGCEAEVLDGSLHWATAELARHKRPATPENLKAVLGPILKYIDFKSLQPGFLMRSNLLSAEDKFVLQHSPDFVTPTLPPDFATRDRSKNKQINLNARDTFFVYGKPRECHTYMCLCNSRLVGRKDFFNMYSYFSEAILEVDCDCEKVAGKTSQVLGVDLSAQVKEGVHGTYLEDLTILVTNDDGVIMNVTHFAGEVNYNSSFAVPLSAIVSFPKDVISLNIKVLFHKTGTYPSRLKIFRLRLSTDWKRIPVHHIETFLGHEPAIFYHDPSFRYVNYIILLRHVT